MPMKPKSPGDNDVVAAFRDHLYETGRRIDAIIRRNGIPDEEAGELKRTASRLAKTGVTYQAHGDTIIDKVTAGIRPSLLERITGHADRHDETNLKNRQTLSAYLSQFDGFDPGAMSSGAPQGAEFLEAQGRRITAIGDAAELISEPFGFLATAEDHYFSMIDVYSTFEAEEIGDLRGRDVVEDPFGSTETDIEMEPVRLTI